MYYIRNNNVLRQEVIKQVLCHYTPIYTASAKSESMVGSLERKQSSSSSRNLAKRMTQILVGEGKQR